MCVLFNDGMGFGNICTIQGHQQSNGNVCSDWMLFSTMRTINNSLGASLRTG